MRSAVWSGERTVRGRGCQRARAPSMSRAARSVRRLACETDGDVLDGDVEDDVAATVS